MFQFDYLVFIGRFQPFHDGHQAVVRHALTLAKNVMILIGSANCPRTLKNPFTYEERVGMILNAFGNEYDGRILCTPLDDDPYNDVKWLANVQSIVFHATDGAGRVGMIGYHKDKSSYYLSLFPHMEQVFAENHANLSATPMREAYFGKGEIDKNIPANVAELLVDFKNSDDFANLQREYRHVADYQKAWQSAPYAPVFVTADALVVQAGHVLLIERGGEYGRGLYALAGGFLDKDETLLECALRELYEETGLIIDKNTLKDTQIFDKPDRSARGRTVTSVFYFELFGDVLPEVKGGDDANRAFWLPLGELDGKMMFEDHYGVIVKMLGL